MLLDILVPLPDSHATTIIAPASAVVAPAPNGGLRHAYFEGVIYRSVPAVFLEKLQQAAGRLVERYPTIAQGHFQDGDFRVVGRFDGLRMVVTEITDLATLSAWAGGDATAVSPVRVPVGKFESQVGIKDETLRRELQRAHPLFGHRNKGAFYWCQLPSGQICRHDMPLGTTEIFDFDTPGLRTQMENAGFPPSIVVRACGTASPEDHPHQTMGR